MTDVIGQGKEKLLLRIFTRSAGLIVSHTYEPQDTLVKKFFPDSRGVIHYVGVDELDQPVDHYFEIEGKGDVAGIVVVPLKGRKVLPVEAQVIGRPRG